MCKICHNALTLKRQRDRKKQAIEYKGGKCELCGYSKCQDAFDFHHTDPEQKEFNLSAGKFTSFNKFKSELDKCMLLCANCHREIHSKK
jgi:predicted HNH restriction endonuclease